jgi:hypothetical protein
MARNIMTEAHVGRLLAACLHQAIGDVLPMRLEFYEVWLRSEGMRDGSIGLAPMSAVLGFLRTEPEYHEVVAHAGRLAARWTIDSMTPMQRRSIGWLPRQLRARAVLRIVAKLVRHICSSSRASTRIKRGHARLEITDSLFCTVREPQKAPMCDFHVAAVVTALEAFGLPAQATVERCLAVDGSACVIGVDLAAAGRWPLHRCLLIACIMLVPPISAFAQAAPGSRLLVMPFSASATAKAPGDAAATLWLGEAAAILLSEELQGLGVGALSRDP